MPGKQAGTRWGVLPLIGAGLLALVCCLALPLLPILAGAWLGAVAVGLPAAGAAVLTVVVALVWRSRRAPSTPSSSTEQSA